MRKIAKEQDKKYALKKRQTFKILEEQANAECEAQRTRSTPKKPRKKKIKAKLIEKLENELHDAIEWKLSQRFRIDENIWECCPPVPAKKEPEKTLGLFMVVWTGCDAQTGEKRVAYKTWEDVQTLL